VINNRNKISIVGAGNVGASCAQRIAEKGYADLVLLDTIEGLPQGKALDILESAPILNFDSQIIGTNSYQETANSDVVIAIAGAPRWPGITREEQLIPNMNIFKEVIPNVVNYSPNCIIIVATNPTEPLIHLTLHISQFSRNRVLGLSGITDSARFRAFIAAELNVSVDNVSACVLGQHGKAMVVIPRLATVNGIAITEILPPETINRLVERTIGGGPEINRLLKNAWSAFTPSAGIVQMAEAIILNKKKILPCATYLQGEYGIENTVIGVPVKLCSAGIEEIIEIELSTEERAALASSAKIVRQMVDTMKLS